MKSLLSTTILLAGAFTSIAAEEQQLTHFSLAQDVINLLSDTEIILSQCQDSQSVQQAIPELNKLADTAREIARKQLSMPDSTLNEDITIARQVKDFETIWAAVRAQIERLENTGLMTDELRKALGVAPTTN
ncbi:MAG: hypothetical protein IKZ13_01400 [Akkermansia sp.]|nr:hypothetical protein [Akkermansia sp.]